MVKVSVTGLDPKAMYSILLEFMQIDAEGRCRYVEGRWIPSGKAERPPANAIYVHNESPNFGAHWMKEPVNFSKLKLSNKKSEPGMVSRTISVVFTALSRTRVSQVLILFQLSLS